MATRKPSSSSSKPLNPKKVEAGKRGGKAGKGAAKARTSDQARASVTARWDKYRRMIAELKAEDPPPPDDLPSEAS